MLASDSNTGSQITQDDLTATFVGLTDAARELGVPPQYILYAVRGANLPSVRIGGARLLYRANWNEFLAKERAAGKRWCAPRETANGNV